LRFKRRAQTRQILVELGIFPGLEVTRVLDDSLPHFEGEVQAGEHRIAPLEQFDDVQRMQVVFKVTAMRSHDAIEFTLARVAERRMSDIVPKECFGQVFIEAEEGRGSACDLSNLDRVSETVMEVIGGQREDLSLVLSGGRPGMNDAITVALEVVPGAMQNSSRRPRLAATKPQSASA
jgi:hypothetical protein